MKFLMLSHLLAFSNILLSQQLIINNGLDTLYFAAENEIQIKTNLDNIVLQANCGELHRVAERYYTFKTCTHKDSTVKFTLGQKGKRQKIIATFNYYIEKAQNPIVVFIGRNTYPVGVRVQMKDVNVAFIVKSYQLEIVKKDGTQLFFKNQGSLLNGDGYMVYRQLQDGDLFRITNVIGRNECEAEDRKISDTRYYTAKWESRE